MWDEQHLPLFSVLPNGTNWFFQASPDVEQVRFDLCVGLICRSLCLPVLQPQQERNLPRFAYGCLRVGRWSVHALDACRIAN